jgi:hypothetical protein
MNLQEFNFRMIKYIQIQYIISGFHLLVTGSWFLVIGCHWLSFMVIDCDLEPVTRNP